VWAGWVKTDLFPLPVVKEPIYSTLNQGRGLRESPERTFGAVAPRLDSRGPFQYCDFHDAQRSCRKRLTKDGKPVNRQHKPKLERKRDPPK
jgi:hypothetical protein